MENGGGGEIHNLRRESATTIYRTSKSPEGHKSYLRAITQKRKTRRNADRRKTQKALPPQKELCFLTGLIEISKPFFETVFLQCTVPELKKKSKKKKLTKLQNLEGNCYGAPDNQRNT